MRLQPTYSPWRQVHSPKSKRWLTSAAAALLAVSGGAAILRRPESGYGMLLVSICCVGALSAVAWGVRILYYRVCLHNARLYNEEIEQVQQRWWEKHQEHVALKEAILLGPAGANATQWHRLINRDHHQPEARNEGGGTVLRLLRSFVSDIAERERQLAQMLVLQWREQHEGVLALTPIQCYWLGSQAAWKVFSVQMAASFPQVVLPKQPLPWQGEQSMSEIIDELGRSAPEATILCAGCRSIRASQNSELPAGEAAVLWLLGKTGKVLFSRGEVFDADIDENIATVTQRSQAQSELDLPPDASFLFSQKSIPDLDKTGWNVTQYVQDLNWGSLAELEPMVVQTLAAIFVEHNATPCGWLARDPHHTLALGIVKPYGSGN